MSTKFLSNKDDSPDIEIGLAAIAATSSKDEAIHLLKDQGYTVTRNYISWFERHHADRLAESRAMIRPKVEQQLADGLLDNARLAQMAINVAIQRTQERLDKGLVHDPDKVARNLADVVSKSVDKQLALEGRPTKIKEDRSVTEIWSQLRQLGAVDAEVVEDA